MQVKEVGQSLLPSSKRVRRRSIGLAAAIAVGVALTGCAADRGNVPVSGVAPTTTAGPYSTNPQSAAKAHDDLADGTAQRAVRAGRLTVNVTYTTPLATSKWTRAGSKPVTVTLSAINNSDGSERIYLSRVRMSATASDANGPIGDPVLITDTANIDPGYLVNFPYTYIQNFTVPAVDPGATTLTLTFNDELLAQVSDGGKDYIKQTAASTIQVPLR